MGKDRDDKKEGVKNPAGSFGCSSLAPSRGLLLPRKSLLIYIVIKILRLEVKIRMIRICSGFSIRGKTSFSAPGDYLSFLPLLTIGQTRKGTDTSH
jgi:hypothetical protein